MKRRTHWRFPQARLLVFAKAPVPGEVKTRLLSVLNARQAAALQARFICRTLAMATQAALCPVELWCSPVCSHPFFIRCERSFGLSLHLQQGADLGARMASAAAKTLARCSYAVLVGCDCPTLTGADLEEALSALHEGCDAVVGPAEDGGYVLVGLRCPAPALFAGMAWGSNRVLIETRARLRALGWRWHELKTHWDVDRPEDLERYSRLLGS
jgi:rSAM/selenodomain-associated transferase 1